METKPAQTEPNEPKSVVPTNIKPVRLNSDYELIVNTKEGQNSVETGNINKKLDAIIIDTKELTDIIIESELGYLILQRKDYIGVHYICIRQRTSTPVEKMIDYSNFEEFNLDEKLIITVRGRRNQDVKFTFRFD